MDSAKAKDPRTAVVAPIEPSHARPARVRETYDDVIDLDRYLDAIRERWRIVAAAPVLAILVTAVLTKFTMTKWYRAEAIIRPVNASSMQARLSGLASGFSVFGGVGGLVGGITGGEASNPASEYIPVLKSFGFTTHLIADHGLESHLRVRGWLGGTPADPAWARYREMRKRFDCEFSIRTGNVTLHYQDPDRAMAGKVLGFYISDLRELLRHEQIQETAGAIASLRAEIRNTPDDLLQSQLYQLLARQVQEQKLAQVEADFAFKVLVPPATPDQPYRPKVLVDCALAGLLAVMAAALAAIALAAREQ